MIFCLYISKGCDFRQLIQSLNDFNFSKKDGVTCLIGDLNFDVSVNNDFSKYLSSLSFSQMIRRATHLDGNVLDHVYFPKHLTKLIEIAHNYVYYSDHDGILVSIKKN